MNTKTFLGRFRSFSIASVAALGVLAGFDSRANVHLPRIFGHNMVLQQEATVPVWGWADPGETVTCEVAGKSATATANAQGQWKLELPSLKADRAVVMTVSGKNTLQFTNILVGEVWLCSGQSNMEMGVAASKDAKKEIAAATNTHIRLFLVPKKTSGTPLHDVDASWVVCHPTNIVKGPYGGFSAAAYYFGREIQQSLRVPVGLIASAWGGTRIEPWTPPTGFAATPALKSIETEVQKADADYPRAYGKALDQMEAAIAAARKALARGEALPPLPQSTVRHALDSHTKPTGLYNAMIHPLIPFAIRGALWYQGESNNGEGMLYQEKMKALIGGWRQVWKQDDFPFLFVQLAPFKYGGPATSLPGIWNAQLASLSIPNTGMAVTTDITTLNDIHPPNKQEVGKRLALWALARTYGKKDLVFSGPLFKTLTPEANSITVRFEHIGSGLATRDGKEATHFEVAGADGRFVPAQARLEADRVVLSAKGVENPRHVRFGWDQLAEPNLINKEGLPASPFSSAELLR